MMMKIAKWLAALILFLIAWNHPAISQQHIQVEPGPEDFALDLISPNAPQLIAICKKRSGRKKKRTMHYVAVDLDNNLPRRIEVEGQTPLSDPYLMTGAKIFQRDGKFILIGNIEHRQSGQHEIVEYELKKETLAFEKRWKDPTQRLGQTNNLLPDQKGGLYVSTFFDKPNWMGGRLFLGFFTKKKEGRILYAKDAEAAFQSEGRLEATNSFTIWQDTLFVTASMENNLFAYPILSDGLGDRIDLPVPIKGGDNVYRDGAYLLTTGAYTKLGFLWNNTFKKASIKSYVYEIKLGEGGPKLMRIIEIDKKQKMGAVSVAYRQGDQYWVGQLYKDTLLTFRENDLVESGTATIKLPKGIVPKGQRKVRVPKFVFKQ
ncbi:MAG: hypothetical protein AAFP19_07125 [Bacteroidota bacterium]